MIVCINRDSIYKVLAVVAMLAVFIAGVVSVGYNTVMTTSSGRHLPIYSVDTGEAKSVALTFDAAWGADKTSKIMEILEAKGVTATFFLVGFWVDKYPDEVVNIHKAGYEIGNHSHNHLKMSTLTVDAIHDEIDYVNDGVEKLTGITPKVFRAPFGDYNNQLIDTISSKNMSTIQWNIDTLDWKGIRPNEILNRVKSRLEHGSVILFHNNSDYVVEALPSVIDYLLAEGYSFSTVSGMIHADNYMIDNNGRQHKK